MISFLNQYQNALTPFNADRWRQGVFGNVANQVGNQAAQQGGNPFAQVASQAAQLQGSQQPQQNPGGVFGNVASQVSAQTGQGTGRPPLTQERWDALAATYDNGTPGSRGIGKMAELIREFYTGSPFPR
jgi:hypothetical protein